MASSEKTSDREAKKAAKAEEKSAKKTLKKAKREGRNNQVKQVWESFKFAQKEEPITAWIIGGIFLGSIAVGVLLSFVLYMGWLGFVLWPLTGLMLGLLLSMIVLGRRVSRIAYTQIEGKPGAAGAVFNSGLRKGWFGAEQPVAFSPRTYDAVYRAIGRGGVVLVVEGPKSRTQKMVADERRKVARILPNVAVTVIYTGDNPDAVKLYKLAKNIYKIKKSLSKSEVTAVINRLQSIQSGLPVPKGIDPMSMRAPHGR